ncbi:MAG: ATP-binding protein [Ruminococcus sp.]|nr:ATP-binding protein [Ruminococcus sp.]
MVIGKFTNSFCIPIVPLPDADGCIYEHYYASALSAETKQENRYRSLQQQFKESGMQYACTLEEGHMDLFFRIYDDDMWEKGGAGAEPEMCTMLHICVEDDGVGFDTEKLTENGFDTGRWDEETGHTHTGLENTKRMLRILYGGQQRFYIHGGEGKGTKIEIILLAERGGDIVEDHGCG